MAVPSKAEFESFFEETKWVPKYINYPDAYEDDENIQNKYVIFAGAMDSQMVYDRCSDARDYAVEHYQQFFNHKIVKYFSAQPGWSYAKTKITRYKHVAEKDIAAIHYDKLMQQLQNELDAEAHWIEIDDIVSKIIDNDPVALPRGMITAYYNYFHTDRSKKIIEASRRADDVLAVTMANLNSLLELGDEFASISFKDISVAVNRLNQLEYNFPVQRGDETLRERVLVYDIYKVFKKYIGKSKADVIPSLLGLEGIEREISSRRIEQLIEAWEKLPQKSRSVSL